MSSPIHFRTHFQLPDPNGFDENVGTELVVRDGDNIFPERLEGGA